MLITFTPPSIRRSDCRVDLHIISATSDSRHDSFGIERRYERVLVMPGGQWFHRMQCKGPVGTAQVGKLKSLHHSPSAQPAEQ